jgi:hypothetical protein
MNDRLGRKVVVACRVMQPELEAASKRVDNVEIRYLDQALHRTPQKMPDLLREQLKEAETYATCIVLGYGLCSNGIAGVKAPRQGLIVPKAHDCIALFLGSLKAYKKAFDARPGTYYLTSGWIAERKDPLGILEEEYVPRHGRETAEWVMLEELKHYTHLTLINTGVVDIGPLRERARKNATHFKKEFEEIEGNLDYFKKIVQGPYTEEDFFFIQPGQEISQELFLADIMK